MARQKAPTSTLDYVRSLREAKEVLRWIRAEVVDRRSRKYIWKMIALSFCLILLQALGPACIGRILTGIQTHSRETLVTGFVSITLCFIAQRVLDRRMAKTREWIHNIHFHNIDRRMTELFLEKSPGQHIQESSLSVSSIEKGRGNLMFLQGVVFFEAVPVVCQLSISLVLLCIASAMAGGMMCVAICLYIAYSMYMNFHVMRVLTPIDRSMRRLYRRRTERMEKSVRVIVSSQQEREVAEMTEWSEREQKKELRFWLRFIEHTTWRGLINVVFLLAIFARGIYLAWNGYCSIGFLYPLFSWTTRIVENIWMLAEIEHKINWSLPSVKSMIKALSIPVDAVDVPGAVTLCAQTPLQICVNNVSHAYPADKKQDHDEDDDPDPDEDAPEDVEVPHTIKKVSFTIEPGEKVALLGPSGAGKTTIMRLLLRFMDPIYGYISVGGQDLRNIVGKSWMSCIGYIAQQPLVFDGTVRENLTYRLSASARHNMTDEMLWELMRELKIDFGTRLDKGLDTRVGKHGLKLSGGQAQRLMIGAAVIGNPWFMVIDEATSSLDSTTERQVQEGLARILSGNTSALVVAHRLSTVRHLCTKFVVLRPASDVVNGDSQVEAVASSFEELYQISPTFRMLADDQGISM